MPSTNVPLPSFAELRHSLNVPPPERQHRDSAPVQPNASTPPLITSPRPILNIDPQGYQIIQGPPTPDQYWWLFHDNRSQGVTNENSPRGNNYTVDKPSAAIATEPDLCLGPSGGFAKDLYHSKSLIHVWLKENHSVYLHPIMGDQRSVIPVASTISFTSTDPTDRALGLPGVTKKGRILLLFPSNSSNAYITHLGLAQAIANGFHDVLSQSPQPRPVHEKTLRLVALYSTDPSGQRWNAAYAIVKMKDSK
ncbi:uncharacterized protein EV420DRAFT_1647849 [Desarmillaria tabescens]|uniref:Uncharacterized protein n=1 Tax=Armillaria tabescens TaxID=1929756 RepID=A0AA39MTV6_ARMTA|nr:uncharacterized protein EV420DRAFT_1647849 [Desarmillaria tabescens]KAK0446956.1 hypothetical protein EV420DRAFT_1647849 [Desarmillaria tabescens]